VVHGYPPSVGGTQWLVKNLSDRLVEMYGDDVAVYTTTAYHMEYFWRADRRAMPPGRELCNGVTIHRFPVYNRLGWLLKVAAHAAYRLRLPGNDWLRTLYNGPIVPGLARAVTNSRAEIILAAAFPHLHMYAALAGARRAGSSLVFLGAIHTADAWGYERPMMYRAVSRADAYVALTTYERDHLAQRGIDPAHIAVIGPGVDASGLAAGDGTELRSRYRLGSAPVVTTIAKQSPRKQLDVLLSAMVYVWQDVPDAHLLIAGARTAYSETLRQRIAALGAQSAQVTVIDDFAESDKAAILAASDVLVLASAHESFGIAFLEAWAAGRPVVGVRAGAVPSVIDDGKDGLLVQFQDPRDMAQAIVKLLSSPTLRERLGKEGRAKVRSEYTWERVTERIRALYAQVASRRAGDRGRAGQAHPSRTP